MNLLTYKPNAASIEEFVSFWSQQYPTDHFPDDIYAANIVGHVTCDKILNLFEWKNGRPLSEAKRRSVHENFVDRLEEVDQLLPDWTAGQFLDRFSRGGAIWRVFWLNCVRQEFPIYDQHVHRAMKFILTGKPEKLPAGDDQRIDKYLTSQGLRP
jgi:hypothetical protein